MEYSNKAFVAAVQEWIHNERDRDVMILHYVDGRTADELAAMFHVEPRQIYRICAKGRKQISKHL